MNDKLEEAIKNGEHVGSFIQRELIEPSGQTLEFIADQIGVHWKSISHVKNGDYKLSPEMASKLSQYFGTYSTQELLTLQAAYDAKKADKASDLKSPEDSPSVIAKKPGRPAKKSRNTSHEFSQADVDAVIGKMVSDFEKRLRQIFSKKATQQLQRIEPQHAPHETDMPGKIQEAIANGEHPGAFIYRELIRPSKQTLQTLAREIGVHYNSLTYLKTQQTSLSPELASKLSHYFGTYTTQELLSIQSAYDAKEADRAYEADLPQNDNHTPSV